MEVSYYTGETLEGRKLEQEKVTEVGGRGRVKTSGTVLSG